MSTESKAIASWDDDPELQAAAEAAASKEAGGGGKFFTTRGGIIKWGGEAVEGNELAVVILDDVNENLYYEDDFNGNALTAPTCFALGRDPKEMAPHPVVFDLDQQQSDDCASCQWNEWGSNKKGGKGKECKNQRRLALLPIGEFNKDGELELADVEDLMTDQIGFFKLSVTSVKEYGKYVKQMDAMYRRPPYAVLTRLFMDRSGQWPIAQFETLGKAPDALREVILARRDEAMKTIEFGYDLEREDDEAPAAPSTAASQKSARTASAPKRKKTASRF